MLTESARQHVMRMLDEFRSDMEFARKQVILNQGSMGLVSKWQNTGGGRGGLSDITACIAMNLVMQDEHYKTKVAFMDCVSDVYEDLMRSDGKTANRITHDMNVSFVLYQYLFEKKTFEQVGKEASFSRQRACRLYDEVVGLIGELAIERRLIPQK